MCSWGKRVGKELHGKPIIWRISKCFPRSRRKTGVWTKGPKKQSSREGEAVPNDSE
jgi:hypothetical protein